VGTKFENELNFLLRSPDVSAHYLVSKRGEIVQMLDPLNYMAWHTGRTRDITKYGNPHAIGVEVHFTPGEGFWTGEMWMGITEIARKFPLLERVTHRYIATPAGRKIDPSGVTDEFFAYWAKHFLRPFSIYKTMTRTNVRKNPTRNSQVITTLTEGTSVFSFNGDVVFGEEINGNNRWRYVLGLGYIYEPLLSLYHTVE
jgi:N-acetyl-anhydromuramyl-L-alanine amidase AmpD